MLTFTGLELESIVAVVFFIADLFLYKYEYEFMPNWQLWVIFILLLPPVTKINKREKIQIGI